MPLRLLTLCLVWIALALGGARALAAQPGPVVALTIAGPINPLVAGYVRRGLQEAESSRAEAVAIRLDTPGGLDSAMREIIQAIDACPIPVIVYVSPGGARAASAGMYITEAAPIAAMAPDTVIGAAHPVGGGGEEIHGVMGQKVTNDAAAYARGLAASHGRNAVWSEQAVRKSVSLSAPEALKAHVIDRIAPDLPSLLRVLDGQHVRTAGGTRVLHTAGSAIVEEPMTLGERFLYALSDPTLALLLLNLGILGIIFELQNPTGLLAGIAGVILLVLGLFALGMAPFHGAGLALIGFGCLLFLLELFLPAHGLLSFGGATALVLGALLLFHQGEGAYVPALPVVATIAGCTAVLLVLGSFFGLRAQRAQPTTGAEALIGRVATARGLLAPEGTVFVEGELWRAISRNGRPIEPGDDVVVEAVDGLTLSVRKKDGLAGN